MSTHTWGTLAKAQATTESSEDVNVAHVSVWATAIFSAVMAAMPESSRRLYRRLCWNFQNWPWQPQAQSPVLPGTKQGQLGHCQSTQVQEQIPWPAIPLSLLASLVPETATTLAGAKDPRARSLEVITSAGAFYQIFHKAQVSKLEDFRRTIQSWHCLCRLQIFLATFPMITY